MKSLGQNPILQLEFARTGANLVAVVDVGDLKDNIDHARAGNTLDTFCFIPAYAGLLSSTGLLLARQDETWRTLLCFVALIAVPVAAVCDWAENAGIAAALDHFAEAGTPQTGDAHRIATPSRIKWLVLALILLIYSGRFPEIGNDQQCARNSCCTRVCWQRGDW